VKLLLVVRLLRNKLWSYPASLAALGAFTAALCVAWPDGHLEEFEGRCNGTMVYPPRGRFGFGYDAVFLPDGFTRTFGELTSQEKHALPPVGHGLSHRARAFLKVTLPVIKPGKGNQITQHRRLELIRRAVTDDHLLLRTRVAACLMLLYAQPVSRLRRLTIDDVIRQDGEVLIRLGDPPAPVPGPFAALLLELASNRENMTTATNPSARWLFPGRRAGQPLNVGTILEELRQLGFSTTRA
jgi:hypothetical protein